MGDEFANESAYMRRLCDLPAHIHTIFPLNEDLQNIPLVSLEEAVKPLISLVPDLEQMIRTTKEYRSKYNHDLTHDEGASILLYTMGWEPQEKSFYTFLNRTLQSVDRSLLKPWLLYIRLMITSYSKLPSSPQHRIVYHGVGSDLNMQYTVGNTVTWWSFTSCTSSLQTLNDERVLGQSGTRTQFSVECYSSRSIKSCSLYPADEEVLLLPGCRFRVASCAYHGDGLHIIKLKEIAPEYPLINLMSQEFIMSSKFEQSSEISKLPDHPNLNLQKRIDALHNNPVIYLIRNHFSQEYN